MTWWDKHPCLSHKFRVLRQPQGYTNFCTRSQAKISVLVPKLLLGNVLASIFPTTF